ncbi:hypothetical protein DN396_29000 [Bacillus sp. BF9-10]|nr:hypothetical protein DN396_29000 [Bacillus sp. BF9-10]
MGYTHIFITKVTNLGYKEGTIILYEIYSRVVTKKVVFLLEGSFFIRKRSRRLSYLSKQI